MRLEKNGKVITKVSFNKNDVVIVLDDETKLKLSNNTFGHFYLYKGKKLSESEIKEIVFENEISSIKNYSLRLLSKKLYSKEEIRNKLKAKKCSLKVINQILKYLEEQKYLDDEKYVKYLLEEYDIKKYGKHKIIFLLQNKGIEDKLIDKIYFDEENEELKAKENLEAYCLINKDKSYLSLKKSGYGYLINRGFSSHIASKVIVYIDQYINKDDDKEKLLKSLMKYVIIHQVDENNQSQKEKLIKKYLSKGYSYNLIKEALEDVWKN